MLVHRHRIPQQLALRGRIILAAAEGKNTSQIARDLGVSVDTVRSWGMRWIRWQAVSLEDVSVSERLTDAARPRRPSQITAEQTCQMIAASLRATETTSDLQVDEARNCRRSQTTRHCGADFSATCRTALKKGDFKPHPIRYWLTPPVDEQREETVRAICTVYQEASQPP